MKKIFTTVVVSLLICMCFLTSCIVPTDEVLMSLGSFSKKEFYTSGGFQDYTDYAKYYYINVNLENNKYLKPITDESKKNLEEHITNFKGWVECIAENDPQNELVVNYDFDMSVVTDDDYLYIHEDPDYDKFGNYNVYLYDTDSDILYFFHNNI